MTPRIGKESRNPDCHPYAEKVCPVCGKVFHPPEPLRWAYRCRRTKNHRIDTVYLCSYPCKGQYETEHPKRRKSVYLDYIVG